MDITYDDDEQPVAAAKGPPPSGRTSAPPSNVRYDACAWKADRAKQEPDPAVRRSSADLEQLQRASREWSAWQLRSPLGGLAQVPPPQPAPVPVPALAPQPPPQSALTPQPQPTPATATISFDRSHKSAPLPPDKTVLEVAESIGVPIDYSCRVGTCGLCKTKLLAGQVTMEVQDALTDDDKTSGTILACQAHSLGDVTVDA